jgi:hypothetical protein
MPQLPHQVENFHNAMQRLVAVQDVGTGLKDLASYTPDTYSFRGNLVICLTLCCAVRLAVWRMSCGRANSLNGSIDNYSSVLGTLARPRPQ